MAHDLAKDKVGFMESGKKEKKIWDISVDIKLLLDHGVRNLMLTGELLTLTVTFAFLEVWKCRERKWLLPLNIMLSIITLLLTVWVEC